MGNFINLTDSPRVSGGRGRGKASTLLAFLPSALSITLSRRVGEHRGQARELVSPQLFTANLFSSRLETISLKIFRFYSLLSTTRSITRIIQTDASCLHLSDFSKSVHDSNEPPRHVYLLSRIALSYCEIIKFTFSITKPKKKKNKKQRLVLLSSSSSSLSDRYTIKREIASWKISWREFHFERKPETMLFRREEREEKMRGSIT